MLHIPAPSPNRLKLLLLLLIRITRLPLLKISPAINSHIPRRLPILLMLPLALPIINLLVLPALLATLLLQLGLHLAPPPVLVVDEHLARLVAPLLGELVRLELGAVDGPLVLADEQHAGVGDGFVETLAVLLVHELGLGLFEAVEGVGRARVLCFIGMDEEGLFAVADFDVGFGDAGLEV